LLKNQQAQLHYPARDIPIAIKSDVKEELDKLVEREILEKDTEPT
jgi:hypothetical protein